MVKPPCERDCPRRPAECHTRFAPYLEYEEAKQAEYRANDGKKNLRPMRSRNKPYKFGNVCKRKGRISRKHGRRRALLFMRDAHS